MARQKRRSGLPNLKMRLATPTLKQHSKPTFLPIACLPLPPKAMWWTCRLTQAPLTLRMLYTQTLATTFWRKSKRQADPLDTVLHNGDIVEIQTKKNAQAQSKWLDFAKTTLARRHIRHALEKDAPSNRKNN
jgi:hypothetical protein